MVLSAQRRDRYRRIAARARRIPGEHGLRVHTVCVVAAFTDGERTGDGTRAEVVASLLEANGQPPKVRWPKDEEKVLGGLPDGIVEIGPITPEFPGGGTSLATITGEDLEPGAVRLVRITGPQHPDGADYRVIATTLDRALRYMIRAIPVGSQA